MDQLYAQYTRYSVYGCLYLLNWTLDWTTGLTFDLILGVLCDLIHNSYYGVD